MPLTSSRGPSTTRPSLQFQTSAAPHNPKKKCPNILGTHPPKAKFRNIPDSRYSSGQKPVTAAKFPHFRDTSLTGGQPNTALTCYVLHFFASLKHQLTLLCWTFGILCSGLYRRYCVSWHPLRSRHIAHPEGKWHNSIFMGYYLPYIQTNYW
jgi:hypothetical protein